jgi:hypothetical protein
LTAGEPRRTIEITTPVGSEPAAELGRSPDDGHHSLPEGVQPHITDGTTYGFTISNRELALVAVVAAALALLAVWRAWRRGH